MLESSLALETDIDTSFASRLGEAHVASSFPSNRSQPARRPPQQTIHAMQEQVDALFADAAAKAEQAEKMAATLAAAESGDVASMAAALDAAGVDVDTPGEDGDTALHIGCLYGQLEVVQECLRRGACVTARDEDNSTPLHDASAGGHDQIVRLLLAGGADVAAQDDDGDSPLHLASNGGHAHVVRTLLDHGAAQVEALCSAMNALGQKPLDLAEDPAVAQALAIGGVDNGMGVATKRTKA